jgi:soluble lytic murein transglycosylase-like protein
MPTIRVLTITAVSLLCVAAPASASVPHTVVSGETLSGVAAANGMSAAALAAANGMAADAWLIAGAVIQIPPLGAPAAAVTAAPAPAVASAAAPAAVTTAPPGRASAADIAAVATRNGVPSRLASAIAWQESGFNNAMVSAAGARGVMQVMPGTWNWVQANLARRQLDPNVPVDNVGAGVLYLGHLLRQTGGDSATAAAAYYQGLSSVRQIGMLPETRRYVDNVLALQGRFG